jgi:UDP-N-acetylglucosamine acyltransferase
MTEIHSTSIVEDGVILGAGVTVGPFCVLSGGVEIGDGTKLHSHVVIGGKTSIGPDCEIFPFASIGLAPQDLKFGGESSELKIGARNRIREYVTMNPGTEGGGLLTSVGDDCLFMIGAHVAHDCRVGNHVILANNATLAGHVEVGDFAIIGGLSAIHQFVKIGEHSMVGGMSGVENNVIPFGSAMGERARLMGLNLIGMKRHDLPRGDIHAVREAYRILFADDGVMAERVEEVTKNYGDVEAVMSIVRFINGDSSRAILQPKATNGD